MNEKKPAWLEASMIVNGELAEAVAEVFARFAAEGGVITESVAIVDERDGPGYPTDEVRVAGYIPMDGQIEDTRQRLLQALGYLRMIEPLPEPDFKPIVEENWMESWKQHFKPLLVGEKFFVIPAWMDEIKPNRIPLKIDVGMAFGTGTHPTTQLSLILLEKYCQPSQQVLDIGCGSGVLAVGAVKLGVKTAYGVDISAESIENANANAALNGVSAQTEFIQGSVSDIQQGKFPIQHAEVVIANILTHILVMLMDEGMGELVSPDGVLLLSGILDEREADITSSLHKHGYQVIERIQQGDWLGLATKR